MRILFACGGTGGHINPALAVAGYIRQQYPDTVIAFAGNPKGMEARLVPQAGFDFLPIHVLGFQRRITLHNLKNNVMASCYLISSAFRSRQLGQGRSRPQRRAWQRSPDREAWGPSPSICRRLRLQNTGSMVSRSTA